MGITRFPSFGVLSVRSIITFALAAFTTVLLWTLFVGSTVQAVSTEAKWNGGSIEHDSRSYYLSGTSAPGNGMGMPADSKYYVYLETPTAPGSAPTTQKAHVIYLKPGNDPPGDGTATYALYDYNTGTKALTNPTDVTALTVDTASINSQVTTCAIEAIGWMVCPAMNFLAWGMDSVFSILASFMEVQPLQVNNTQGALYNAWSIMRTIANLVFIIFFIIIIYAQLASVQVNNYGLKRLLPRLIIAAVAINLSYLICAAAVDVSNVLGFSIHQMFTDLRNTLLSTGVTDAATNASRTDWESVTGFVLSGGTAGAALVVGGVGTIIATGGVVTAAVFLLLPALVGLLMTLLVVLLVLAARQALIVILVIIAPLAIVAYLLPNTEGWFTKWRGLLMTMLIFFPAFSVVFGGSQIAGAVIIQNASSINILILGMIVQVAPLVITPLLLRFSGSLLASVARIVNNPNKGIIDRTRKWSGDRAKFHADRGRANLDRKGNPRLNADGTPKRLPKYGTRNMARQLDQRKRQLSDRTNNAETATQNAYENSSYYNGKLDANGNAVNGVAMQKAVLEAQRDATHAHHANTLDTARRTQGSPLYAPAMAAQEQKEQAETSQNLTTAYYNRARSDSAWANRVGASALHNSSYNLETSKSVVENSENLKTAYFTQQRTNTVTSMAIAAQSAQSSKEHLEGAQNQLQAYFDTQRRTAGTTLNASTIRLEDTKNLAESSKKNLEGYLDIQRTSGALSSSTHRLETSKSVADIAKANLAKHLADDRSRIGSTLHNISVSAEAAKQGQQQAEARFTRIVEEYQAGGQDSPAGMRIDGQLVSAAQQQLANQMHENAAKISAEKQGAVSAQYIQQERISKLMDEDSTNPLTATLLRTAGGIDPNGQIRAQANALSQIDKLQKDVLGNSVTLLGERAERQGKTAVQLAKEMYAKQTGQYRDEHNKLQPREEQDTTMLEAAFEALAQDGAVPTLRDARLDTNEPYIDQDMLTRLFARHSGTMKAKGGFDLQADPSLAGASRERMDTSIAGALGDVTASNIASQKAGEWESVANRIDDIVTNTENFVYDADDPVKDAEARAKKEASLLSTYRNVTMALTNPNVLKDIGDRLENTIKIHQRLHAKFNNPEMAVDYDLARKGQGPAPRRRP